MIKLSSYEKKKRRRLFRVTQRITAFYNKVCISNVISMENIGYGFDKSNYEQAINFTSQNWAKVWVYLQDNFHEQACLALKKAQ